MNDLVKNCIESRRTAIFNAYDVKNEENLSKIDEFFNKLEQFANDYDDVMSFESAFASSELNQEYMDLFTKIASTESPKNIDVNSYIPEKIVDISAKDAGEMFVDEVARDVTSTVRGRAYREAYDKVRDIPGVGEAIDIKNKLGFFRSFRKDK